MDFRKISNVSVECVILGLDESGLKILLSKRNLNMFDDKYPEIDDWILTGQQVLKSETFDESAERIYRNYTGLNGVFKRQFRTLGNPSRIKNNNDLTWMRSQDLNHRSMAVAYFFLMPVEYLEIKDADLSWFSLKKLPVLGFDHQEIINRAYLALQKDSLNEPLVFELLPDKFTLNELQFAYESVYDINLDNRNFRKKAISKTYIVAMDEKQTGNSKKPANLYMFSRDIYEKTSKSGNLFTL